jgi:NitT/TauT family transport system permease protein
MSMSFTMDVAGQFSILIVLSLLGLLLHTLIVLVRKRLLFWDRSQNMAPEVAAEGEIR